MGFYIRKSKKIGPFRINFSNKGIGLSSGVRGARISTNSKGTYINTGSNGLYYRKKIGPGIPQLSFANLFGLNNNSGGQSVPKLPNAIKASGIDDGIDMNKLLAAPNAQAAAQINSKINKAGIMPVMIAVIVIAGCLTLVSYPAKLLIYIIIAVLSLIAANIYDNSQRTTELLYDLDDAARDTFDKLNQALCALSAAQALWQVNTLRSQPPSADNKYGLEVIARRLISMSDAPPLFIETDVAVFSINMGETALYFFPDKLMIYKNLIYFPIPYDELKIKHTAVPFIEYESCPADANIKSHKYLYSNKDGSPDKRYSNNPQLPVVSYGLLKLYSISGGLEINIMVSNNAIAEKFLNDLSYYLKIINTQSLP